MSNIKGYLLSIIAAAIICAITNALLHKKSAYAALAKLITGVFLTVTIVAPWKDFRFDFITEYTEDVSNAAAAAANVGTESAQQAIGEIIKSKTEAYILDKAVSMGLNIEVEVTLDSSDPPLPQRVTIKGAVSPYAKEKLTKCIAENLAIPEEEQLWI